MLDKIEFLLNEAFVALRRNGLMSFAAISTVAVSLFLLGGFAYIYFRVSEYAENLPGKFWMRAFIQDGTTYEEIRQTAAAMREIPGVKDASWIPKDKAWKRLLEERPEWGTDEDMENPLPDAFKVTIKDLSQGKKIAAALREVQINGKKTVYQVEYLDEEQTFIDQVMKLNRLIGIMMGGLLFATSGILIYNAIRLTVLSRRLEIRIMQLVGASQWTMRIPFLIEGVLQGAAGGLVATFILKSGDYLVRKAIENLQAFSQPAPFPFWQACFWLILTGAMYGLLCSLMAVRKPLKFR